MQDWGDSQCLDVDHSDKRCFAECLLTGVNCFTLADGSAMVNAHGDWQQSGGPDYPNFAMDWTGEDMEISHRLNFFYMLDDVRPTGAPPMTFYAYSAINVLKPGTMAKRPASRLTADNWWDYNGLNSVEHHDGINVIARVETAWYGESWSYFSFKTPFAGELIPDSSSLHTHMNGFHLSLMTRGLPKDFLPASIASLRPVGTDCVIYKGADVAQAALDKLSANFEHDDRLLCEMKPHFDWGLGYDMVEMKTDKTFQYDRRAKSRCRSVHWEAGEVLTAIATHGQVGDVPMNTMIHTNWNLRYWADDGITHTTTTSGAFSDTPLAYYYIEELPKLIIFITGKGHASGVDYVNPDWLKAPMWMMCAPPLLGMLASVLLLDRPTRKQRLGCIVAGFGVSVIAVILYFSYRIPLLGYNMRDQRSAALLMAKDGATKATHFAIRAAIFAFGAGLVTLGYALVANDEPEESGLAIPQVQATPRSKAEHLV
jgi:hypothetical protein